MLYTQSQWLLLFFLYCVAGWVWESLYVSVKKRSWVNRGFLHGPWLPIYGTGAILILFTTLPCQESISLTFLVGMVTATLLEGATGMVMERVFHMRWWDYSDQPLNWKGYVCLWVSVAWGFFTLLLVYVLHPPMERLQSILSYGKSHWRTRSLHRAMSILRRNPSAISHHHREAFVSLKNLKKIKTHKKRRV